MDPGPCMLPPCVICGDRSSGYHYGANTCEACKSFFRRCMIRKREEFRCKHKGNCMISPSKNNVCKGCRYRKCIQNGMSKEASNKGRYTLEKKNKNIEIVNFMERQGKMKDNGVINMQYNHENEMDKLIKNISRVHLFQRHTDSSLEELYRIEEEYVEQKELDEIIFGNIDNLSREDCDHIYRCKGIDVDGFQEKIKNLKPIVKLRMLDFVSFAKSLPGFNDLPVEDQFTLVTESELDHWLFLNAQWSNPEKHLIVSPFNKKVIFSYMDMVRIVGTVETCEKVWSVLERIQRLELNPDECNVASALSLMSGGVPISTVGQHIVSKIVDHLLDMLIHLINKNHDAEEHTLPKLMIILTDIKNLQKFSGSLKKSIHDSVQGDMCNIPTMLMQLLQSSHIPASRISTNMQLVELELD